MAVADEVGRDDLGAVDVVELLVQVAVERGLAQEVVELLALDAPLQGEVEDRHRHVGGRHAHRVAGELALELGQRLGHGLGRAGLGQHHVERRRAATPLALVEVVDEVLVVGEGVDRLDVATDDAVLVVDDLQRRDDRVGRARSGGDDLAVADHRVVDPADDVGQATLARRREQHAGDAGAGEVLGQALLVAPLAGVVDDDRVVDAVLRVVDARRVVGVDDLDEGAVGEDRAGLLVDGDRAGEGAVDRVAAQQAGALGQVVVGALAHDDGAQAQAVTGAGVLDEDAREQTADTAEAVEDDVGARQLALAVLADDVSELGAQEVLERDTLAGLEAAAVQAGDVDGGRAGLKGGERLEHRQGVVDGQRDVDATGEAVRLEHVGRGLAEEGAAVDRGHDPELAVESAHDGDHRLRLGLAVGPLGEVVVGCVARLRRRRHGPRS